MVPVGFNIAHVLLFVCRQLTPETSTGYWYQKTGQCVWPLNCLLVNVLTRESPWCQHMLNTSTCCPVSVQTKVGRTPVHSTGSNFRKTDFWPDFNGFCHVGVALTSCSQRQTRVPGVWVGCVALLYRIELTLCVCVGSMTL